MWLPQADEYVDMGHAASTCQQTFSRIISNCQEKISKKDISKTDQDLEYVNGDSCIDRQSHSEDCNVSNKSVVSLIAKAEKDIVGNSYHSVDSDILAVCDLVSDESYDEATSVCRKFSTRSKSIAFEKYILNKRANSDLESPSENEDRSFTHEAEIEISTNIKQNSVGYHVTNDKKDLNNKKHLKYQDNSNESGHENQTKVVDQQFVNNYGCNAKFVFNSQNEVKKEKVDLEKKINRICAKNISRFDSCFAGDDCICDDYFKGRENIDEKVFMFKTDDPVVALENKQDEIFHRLENLKIAVLQLQKKYGETTPTPISPSVGASIGSNAGTTLTSTSAPVDFGDVAHDIVINADPEYVPLSLFILSNSLKQKYKVKGTAHVHSSVTSISDMLKYPFNGLNSKDGRSSHQIIITLIWKKVGNNPEMMVSAHKQTPVQGEVNIARYLSRLLDSNFDGRDITAATKVDDWLDLAMNQVQNGNNKERAACLRTLNSRLGKNDWLVGSSISLADIVMWSSLNQSQLTTDVPANVQKWLKTCNQCDMFKSVESFLS